MPSDKIDNKHISYMFTYVMVFLFGLTVAASFIAYSFSDKVKDVPLEWLVAYVSLLSWYVGKKQWHRNDDHQAKRFPGEIFVGLCWSIYIILPFLEQLNIVTRKSPLLTPYFLAITGIYAGGAFLKYYKNGSRFFSANS